MARRASPAQLRARATFAARARNGAFKNRGKNLHKKLPAGTSGPLPPGVTRTKQGYKITGPALAKFKAYMRSD